MTAEFKPLEGIRVVEMSHMVMGPSCGMFLAFLGAEVVKVEPPGGDKTRQLTGMGSAFFPLFNRRKKSVVLDSRTPAGRKALDRLLASADVFIDNFKDSTLQGMGLDAETLHDRFPQLICASHKGFLSGPYERRTALDEVVQMMSGLAYMTGPKGRPLRVGTSANDIMGGLFGAFAVIAALFERGKTGEGRTIRVGLFENCLLLVSQHMVQFELEGRDPEPMPERAFSWPIYDVFADAEGGQIFIGAVSDGHWTRLCGYLGLDDLLQHPELQSRMARINARSWVVPLVAAAVARRPMAELLPALEKMEIPFAPVAKPSDLFRDQHVMRQGGLASSQTADGRTFRAPALPIEIDGASLAGGGDVDGIGGHNAEILGRLGLTPEEIAAAAKAPSGEAA
ncbi:crotonobetainyl-CoA:carnitine CoA-transferase CaiB-like acyl-CoA transferase [Paracoccus pantotrophus]|uniref:CoA transferase n=1 Tax=Paracoccus pantotrophus TaxID=82367 RepID=A0AAE6NTM6_PARPN|nr:CoA transferase [Paracoccus pantotrophus]QFG34967.1 CoA transferase [Paracoccus pantotrophus]RKS44861.1 crotonobetainyl-CoA:carnitine CoA-transferase CaiB-like acyl-CoA transferase [Paracoccus pantotrophus]